MKQTMLNFIKDKHNATGIVYLKYQLWRLEHPEVKTWVFFIPNKK